MSIDPAVFSLSDAQLLEIAGTLERRIAEGLAADGLEIKALPSFLGPPRGAQGTVLAFDTGGTNMRAAVVELRAGGAEIIRGPVEQRVPDGRDGRSVDAAAFFDAHADLARAIDGRGLPIGYCFSYPSRSQPDRDATLIAWTKGVRVDGVEGTPVGRGLHKALAAAGLDPGPVTVLNDTVAALLALGPAEEGLGLIVGTGHNIAAYYPRESIRKLPENPLPRMAVNLELGNYHPPHLSRFDDALDASLGEIGGRQRLEKSVSGYYLPKIQALADPEHAVTDGKALGELARSEAPGAAIARAILERSADLVAAALAGVLASVGVQNQARIAAEGSLFWSPGYAVRAEATLRRLSRAPFTIERAHDPNLIGAALAAR
ncbi:MAG: hypothetical protein U1E65_28080 [Myxococcota bacterium]